MKWLVYKLQTRCWANSNPQLLYVEKKINIFNGFEFFAKWIEDAPQGFPF